MSGLDGVIVADRLRKRYGAVEAVADVSFVVPEGEVFGLLGPNGAGKSTTIRMLTTLSKPDGGSAHVAGHNVASKSKAVREAIGYIAQSSGTDLYLTGRENLLVQAAIHRIRRSDARRRAGELLELVGLTDSADSPVKAYSGGMKRRLEIAMGIVHNPRVLFLDEPTTGLDPEARSVMWRELTRLKHELNLTILLTTHYLEEADQLADTIAIINDGRVVAQGSPESLKSAFVADFVKLEFFSTIEAGTAGQLMIDAGAQEVTVDGVLVSSRMEHSSRTLMAILARLADADLRAESISVSRPSLDDVYLHHTEGSFGGRKGLECLAVDGVSK